MSRRRAGGFTIVELLVVVAILVILMSLVMPVLKVIKFTVANDLCASNQMDLYEAQEVYLAAFGGKIPPVGAYLRTGRGNGDLVGLDHSPDRKPRLYWAGFYARNEYISDGHTLVCPSTLLREGHAASKARQLAGTSPRDWSNSFEDTPGYRPMFGSYVCRWSGRKDKVYSYERLMFADHASAYWGGPIMNPGWYDRGKTPDIIEMHGGANYTKSGQNERSSNVGMNVTSSSGRILGLQDYSDTLKWLWPDTYYWPDNERSGDEVVSTVPWDGSPSWSDGGWGFWSSFDMELFDGTKFPWGETLDEKPGDW